jgi:CspA family cold shock protein
MVTRGTVRAWNEEEGWGVIDSTDTPGGCWVHFSHIVASGYRSLQVGEDVLLEWEEVDQDGYAFRALRVRRVRRDEGPPKAEDPHASSGYRSILVLSFDEPDAPGPRDPLS